MCFWMRFLYREATRRRDIRRPPQNKEQDRSSACGEERSELRNMEKGRMSKMFSLGIESKRKQGAQGAPSYLARAAEHIAVVFTKMWKIGPGGCRLCKEMGDASPWHKKMLIR